MIFYLVFSIGCLIYFVWGESRFSSRYRFLWKMINSFNFCILAFLCYRQNNTETLARYILWALGLGLLGDVFLGLQHVYPRKRSLYFKLGFAFFLAGHVVYIIYFISSNTLTPLVPILMATIIVILFVIFRRLKISFGEYKLLIFIYLIPISFVWGSSFNVILNHSTTGSMIFFMGITFFFASDALLSILYTTDVTNKKILKIINSSLYFTGQILIAVSIYFH